MRLVLLTFEDAEDAFDVDEVVAYEATTLKVDSEGNYNERGRTTIRNATLYLRSGQTFKTTFYPEEWLGFEGAMHDRHG